MSEPYGQLGRLLLGLCLVALLSGCLVWAGATTGDLTESEYPDEGDVTPNPEAYVGEQVVLGGYVVETDPVVIATRASGHGRFTLVDADDRLRSGDGPLERGDQVTAFGTLEDDSTLAVERSMTRESSETGYMLLVSALGGLWVAGRFVRHWRLERRMLAFTLRERPRDSHSDRDNGSSTPRGSASERGSRDEGAVDSNGRPSATDDQPPTHRQRRDRSAPEGGERRA